MEQDSPWKDVLEDLFQDFLAFFFPDVHRDIDFAKGYQFLDTELQKIMRDAETGKRIVDKLVSVCLKDGTEKWLLIHIEIQGYEDPQFPERMYVYNYRIFDHLHKEVASLAVLTDPNPNFRPSQYCRTLWKFRLLCEFPVVKLIDYWEVWEELEKNPNSFAIVVRAFLKATQLKGDVRERFAWKRAFVEELYNKGLEHETILKIFKFIDWLFVLPLELEVEIRQLARTLREGTCMPYITSIERLAKSEGLAEGIAAILEVKFGDAGKHLIPRALEVQEPADLQKLMASLKRAKDVKEAEKCFGAIV